MRLCVPGSFVAMLLAASSLSTVAYSQPRAIEPGEDFPLEDHAVWRFVERGLKNQAADLQLAKAPESPETVALLLDAYRPGDALMVLRPIVDRRPERMGAAFKNASTNGHRFDDDGRGYRTALREIVARARQRLPELTREQAGETAWYLRFLAFPAPGETPAPQADQLRAFLTEYSGTQAALLAHLRSNFVYGRTFLNDADLDQQRRHWLDRVANVRVHATTHERPRDRFDREERVHLQPLASRRYTSLVLDGAATSAPTRSRPPRPLVDVEKRSLAVYAQLTGGLT